MLSQTDLARASIYFQYYLNRALAKVGLGNEYLEHLDVWREYMKLGMTTWGEDSKTMNTRSDCHAWGASPNIEFFRIVLGIDSDAPGFGKVKIVPHLGTLNKACGEMPHPSGTIRAGYERKGKKWLVKIELPQAVGGFLVWEGKEYQLREGENQFNF